MLLNEISQQRTARALPGVDMIWDKPYERCVACDSPRIRYWRSKSCSGSAGEHVRPFAIFCCRACGTGFLNPPPHDALLKQIYRLSGHGLDSPVNPRDVIARERERPASTRDAERIVSRARSLAHAATGNALDIGSGFGFHTGVLIRHGYRTLSINPGEYENRVFQEMHGYEPVAVYFEDFATETQFDIVLMSHVLEHMKSPGTALQKVAQLLSRGGVFACVVPNFESFSVKIRGTRDNGCLWVPEHVNYFTTAGLTRLVTACGLRVVHRDYLTRMPGNALSRRLGLSDTGALQRFLQRGQDRLARLADRLGYGICINLYAIRE